MFSKEVKMSLKSVSPGSNLPDEFNVVIEISAQSEPVKYEIDENGVMWVDRFIGTAMRYPCNYGFIPQTLAGDGDPVDALVITPFPLLPGTVIKCRAVGILNMTDEAGKDGKLIAVPINKVCRNYYNVHAIENICSTLRVQIKHFFEQYKALELGKWVKIDGYGNLDEAKIEILEGVERYKRSQEQKRKENLEALKIQKASRLGKRGRPRIRPLPEAGTDPSVKRSPGRPRKKLSAIFQATPTITDIENT